MKRIEGSSRNVIDPFESIVKNTFKSMQAIERNKVGLSLADLAEKKAQGNGLKSLPVMEKSLWQKKILLLFSVMVKRTVSTCAGVVSCRESNGQGSDE